MVNHQILIHQKLNIIVINSYNQIQKLGRHVKFLFKMKSHR